MNETRNRILGRLRNGIARPPGFEPDTDPAAEPAIPMRRFAWTPAERLQRFQDRIEAARGEVHRVGDDWPLTLLQILRDKGAGNLMYGPGSPLSDDLLAAWPDDPQLDLLPYHEPVEAIRDILFEQVSASVTSCRGAVAETGSLALWPTSAEPRLLSLVPPIHCVLLHATRIHSTFAELLAEQRWSQNMPTNALLISGPSKSADIEQTLAYGVHGPKELIVLLYCTPPTSELG